MSDQQTGVVDIRGKSYQTVALRVQKFREKYPSWSLMTELLSSDGDRVVMKASVVDEAGKTISTGYAEEERGSTNINKTSALENCETSAVGRALAFFGMGGTEIASADEVANAINQQTEKNLYAEAARHMQAVINNLESVQAIKGGILEGKLDVAAEAWFELNDDTKAALWRAPSKGGVFTTEERTAIKSSEFREAYTGK